LARRLGVSSGVIGLTVVALGTSTPELFVSCLGAANGQGDTALGNIVGSNIGNLSFILGCVAVFMPMAVSSKLLRFDVWIMLATAAVVSFVSLDGRVSRTEGVALLVGLVVYLVTTVKMAAPAGVESHGANPMSIAHSVSFIALGLVALVVGSQMVLTSSVMLARSIGLSELFIGLTLVAIGTSLPELVTSLMALKRGDSEMSAGNLIGSNILNVLAILGPSSIIAPDGLAVPELARSFDIPVMLGVTVGIILVFRRYGMVSRSVGGLLVAGWGLYVASLLVDWKNPTAFSWLMAAAALFAVFASAAFLCGRPAPSAESVALTEDHS
jgi:cation:H+ antiporter